MTAASQSSGERFPAGYFVGETTSWEADGALLAEVRHAVAKTVPRHEHQAPYFSLLLEGTYREWGASFDLRYEPYTLVFHSAGTLHEDRMLGPCRFFAVTFREKWESVIAELGGARAHVFELDGGEAVWLVLRLYREFLARTGDPNASVEALLYELCSHVAARSPDELREPPWLRDVDALVRERFREPLELCAIASQVNVHAAHLCRAFRRFRGRTISDALIGVRLQHVCRMLAESDEPLARVAAEAGFTDQSHMSNVFKRITGNTPAAHRRSERMKRS